MEHFKAKFLIVQNKSKQDFEGVDAFTFESSEH